MDWQTLSRELGLSPVQEPAVRERIDAAKDRFAEVCRHPSASGQGSPLEAVVAMFRLLPRPGEAEVAARLLGFLRSEQDGTTGRPYTEGCGEVDHAARLEVLALLDPPQQERFTGLPIDSLLDVSTGHDALGEQIRRCLMAGEPLEESPAQEPLPEPRYRGLFCSQPFEYAQVESDGSLYLCCPQTLPQPVGNLGRTGLMEAWNSDMAAQVRASVLDGTYRYCSERTCGLLQQRMLPRSEEVTDPFHRQVIDQGLTRLERGPATLNLSYDRTCNLACPSCRTQLIVLRGRERDQAAHIHDKVMGDHLRDARRLIITGSGDPFASHFYLHFLRTFEPESAPGLHIQLSTNGVLLTPATWESICHERVDWVDVSVDAATPETYALNRGGDFDRLLENLAFLAGLRASGEIRLLQLHYVVQANNYREMKAFAELGMRLGCDRVCFKQIVNWGTFSEAEFLGRAVQRSGHPEHGDFLDVLRDPIFRQPAVYLHDLGKLHQSAAGTELTGAEPSAARWILPA